MRKYLAVFTAIAVVGVAYGGRVIEDDFNSGVFVASSTRSLIDYVPYGGDNPDSDPERYDWQGPGDDLDGWIVNRWQYADTTPGVTKYDPADESYWYHGSFDAFFDIGVPVPSSIVTITGAGSNHIGGNNLGDHDGDGNLDADDWASTDGNIGGYHDELNDAPQGGWTYTTTLDASDGGARDADGDALAFTIIYDAECTFLDPDQVAGWGNMDVELILDETVHEVGSPLFDARGTDPGTYPDWELPEGAVDVSQYTPEIAGFFDTDDDLDKCPAARGVTSGVIEQKVADGAEITVWQQTGRSWDYTFGEKWPPRHLGIAMDNLKVAALEAGDSDGDLEVDIDDASMMVAGWGNTGTDATWANGDYDGDDDVDLDDASALLTNWQSSYDVAAGTAEIHWDDANNKVVVEADSVALVKLESSDGCFVENGYTPCVAYSTAQQPSADGLVAGEFMTANAVTGLGEVALASESGTVTLTYQLVGEEPVIAQTINIPEPASAAILGLGGLAAVLRRRRRK